MNLSESIKKFWSFLKKDTWQSWLVSLILIIIIIKFIFFPLLALITGTSLPLVVVESCSMYHESDFQSWWAQNQDWYTTRNISEQDFKTFSFQNGLNKGDIVFVLGEKNYKKGDVIIFDSITQYPIIHRIVGFNPINTKGDHNTDQLSVEKNISPDAVVGKAIFKIPAVGWIKLIFFDLSGKSQEPGLCH